MERSECDLRAAMESGALNARSVELAAYCGHASSRALLEFTADVHDPPTVEAWIAGLKPFGVEAMVRATLGATRRSFSLLRGVPWIIECSMPLLRPVVLWARFPTRENAVKCARAAREGESLADTADAASTQTGDWWSYKTIELVSLLPEAIALYTAVNAPTQAVPGPPEGEIEAVCNWIADLLGDSEKECGAVKTAMALYIVPWALGDGEPLDDFPLLSLAPPNDASRPT